MSHFSVAVFTDENVTIEDLLEPYYEGIEVEKYIAMTKEEVIQREKERIKYLKKLYKEYMKDKRKYRREHFKNINHLRFIKKVPSMAKWNNEKVYKYAIRYYDEEEISEEGGIYSTYNPNSKWDWYKIGGRWDNRLIIGEGDNIKNVNSAEIKDIRWDLMKEFRTYAVLTLDGEWHEPGKVGWWGISSATPEQEAEFENNYEKKFIKEAKPEWNLSIVDCHI